MTTRPSPPITIRYNADLSQSLIANGRVMYKVKANAFQQDSVNAWLDGWFGAGPRRFNAPVFVYSKRGAKAAAVAQAEG